jgi:hypothetical protein
MSIISWPNVFIRVQYLIIFDSPKNVEFFTLFGITKKIGIYRLCWHPIAKELTTFPSMCWWCNNGDILPHYLFSIFSFTFFPLFYINWTSFFQNPFFGTMQWFFTGNSGWKNHFKLKWTTTFKSNELLLSTQNNFNFWKFNLLLRCQVTSY